MDFDTGTSLKAQEATMSEVLEIKATMAREKEVQEKCHQELRELMKQMVPAPTTTATAAAINPDHDPEQEKRKRAMFAGIGVMLAGAKLKKAKTGDSDKDKGKGDVKQKTMMDEMNEKLTNRTAATADDSSSD